MEADYVLMLEVFVNVDLDFRILFVFVLFREATLFTGWGGAGGSGIPYNSRESPYLRKRFFTCPFFLPKDSEKNVGLKFFAPP